MSRDEFALAAAYLRDGHPTREQRAVLRHVRTVHDAPAVFEGAILRALDVASDRQRDRLRRAFPRLVAAWAAVRELGVTGFLADLRRTTSQPPCRARRRRRGQGKTTAATPATRGGGHRET